MAQSQAAPWDQQRGENDLWYARFVRYVALGPGRSVSLVATGRRNAYPVPAHWPMQSKQMAWKARAEAFDRAAKEDPTLIDAFNDRLIIVAASAPNGEADKLKGKKYQTPAPDEYEDEEPSTRSS